MNKNENFQFRLFNKILDEKRDKNNNSFFEALEISKDSKAFQGEIEKSYVDFYIPNYYTYDNKKINIQSTNVTISKISNVAYNFHGDLNYIKKNNLGWDESKKAWEKWKNDIDNNFIKLSAEQLVEELIISWENYIINKNTLHKKRFETIEENSILFLFNDFCDGISSIIFTNCKSDIRTNIFFLDVFSKIINKILLALTSTENKKRNSFWKLFFYVRINYSLESFYVNDSFNYKDHLFYRYLNKNCTKECHLEDFNKWDEKTAKSMGLDFAKDNPYDHKAYIKWSKQKNILVPIFKNVLKMGK